MKLKKGLPKFPLHINRFYALVSGKSPLTTEKIIALCCILFLVSPGGYDSELSPTDICAAQASDTEFVEGAPDRAVCGEPYRRVLTTHVL